MKAQIDFPQKNMSIIMLLHSHVQKNLFFFIGPVLYLRDLHTSPLHYK